MKIIFIGTPEFGTIVLGGLVNNNYKPVLVITETDKPVGRKHIITPPPVKVLGERYKIKVLQPEKIINLKSEILNLKPDLVVVAAYGKILPKEILEIPKYGCFNVHPSLLPKYRGPSPIQSAILSGDKKTGVTIMQMVKKMDAGPMLMQKEIELAENETYENLHNKLAELGVELLIKAVPSFAEGKIKPTLQDEIKATYTKILKKEDGKIDWSKKAIEIERQIRAFCPWPGSFTGYSDSIDNKENIYTIKIWKVKTQKQHAVGPFGAPGKTFMAPNEKIAVQAGEDFLIIEELQLSGGKKMTSEEFLKGHQDFIGVILK